MQTLQQLAAQAAGPGGAAAGGRRGRGRVRLTAPVRTAAVSADLMAVAIAQLAERPDLARLSEAPRNWAGDAQLPATVRLVPGGALASRPRWDPDRVLTEVVRAVPKFHSLPW